MSIFIPLILCCCYASSAVGAMILSKKIPSIAQYASTINSIASSSLSLILICIALIITGMVLSVGKSF